MYAMSRPRDAKAAAKAIGEEVESLVIEAIPGLQAAVDAEDWYDAVVTEIVGPRTCPELIFGGIAVLLPARKVEIKACKRRVSHGDRTRPGRWLLQIDQHERLVDAGAVYLLAVYGTTPDGETLEDMIAVPATLVDSHLRDNWYRVARHGGEVAQLAWLELIGREVTGSGD